MAKNFLRIAHLIFAITLAAQFLPDRVIGATFTGHTIAAAVGAEIILLIASALISAKTRRNLIADIASFFFIFLLAWTLLTAKSNYLPAAFFPPPGVVFEQAVAQRVAIGINIKTSLGIIATGYALGVGLAIPLGLLFGWSIRLGGAATYLAKFLGSIPPVVYIPYGIALLPTFRSVSVMVIFLAAFWPALASTMSGVLNVEKQLLDTARSMNVGKLTLLFQVILPAALPQIFIGCNQGLGVAFILLTAAEMLGARNGMGYYVKNFSDLGDYTSVILGVLVIGVVVTFITCLFNALQRRLLRWKE